MSARHATISVRPERCDHCGACVTACDKRLIRVGAGFLYVDPTGCDGCLKCVDACSRGAIESGMSRGAMGTPVVRSRSEAKALKRAAEQERSVAKRPAAGVAKPKSAAASDAAPWSLLDAMAVLAVLLVAFLAKEAALSSELFRVMPEAGRMTARGLVLAAFYGVQLAALAFIVHRHGLGFSEAFGLRRDETDVREVLVNASLVAALFIATRAVSVAWGALSRSMGFAVPAGERIVDLFGSGPAGLIVSIAVVVLVAPVSEELLFRGVVLGGLQNRFGRWPAILGSAIAFAALHVTPWLLVSTFVLGVACGWLASSRRSLVSAIALHVLYNGSVVAAAFWLAR